MDVSYNGIVFAIVKTNEVSFAPVWSEDGTTYLYTRVLIDVEGILNPYAMAYTSSGGLPLYEPGVTPPITVTSIRHALEQPRAQLIVSSQTGDNLAPTWDVIESPVQGYPCDCNNGPKPGPCRVFSVSGAKTWYIAWTCETWIHECPNEDGILFPELISNRYSREDQLDEQYKSTIISSGVAMFRTDILEANNKVADDFRHLILPPVPFGFQRRRINVTAVPNRNALRWSTTDQEMMFDLGDTTATGSFITDVQGTYGITTLTTADGFANGQSLGQFFVRVRGTKQANPWILIQRCFQFAAQKIPFGVAGAGHMRQLSVTQSLVDRDVSLNVVWCFLPPIPALIGAIDFASLQNPVFADQGGVNPSPPWGIGTMGTSRLELLVADLEDACLGASLPICNEEGPVSGGSNQCGPEPAVSVTTSTFLPTYQPNIVPDPNPYNVYDMKTRYYRKSNILQAPIAGPSPGSSSGTSPGSSSGDGGGTSGTGSNFLSSSGNQPTAAFFQLALPTSKVVVEWKCERVGANPQIPDPNTGNENYVLLNCEIVPSGPQIIADGLTPVFVISGRYEFGAVTAMGLNDNLGMGLLPWVAANFTDFEVQEQDYTQGMYDGGQDNFG